MELFLSLTDFSSWAARLLASYTRADLKLTYLSAEACKHIGLQIPTLIQPDKLVHLPVELYSRITRISRTSHVMDGETPLLRSQVISWVHAAHTLSEEEFLALLNEKLRSRTFLVSNHITTADIVAFSKVWNSLFYASDQAKLRTVNVIRWVSHLQSLAGMDKALPAKITIPAKSSPIVPEKLLQPEAASSAPAQVKEETKQPQKQPQAAKKQASQKQPQTAKKEAPQKTEETKEPAKKTPPPKKQAEVKPEGNPFGYLDIRVGRGSNVRRHPDPEASKTYVVDVILGGETRQICTAVFGHVEPQDLERGLVVLCNLKPRMLKGVESQGMILFSEFEAKFAPVRPPEGSQPGDRVFVEGVEPSPLPQLPPKKKYWEKVMPQLHVGPDGSALYGELVMLTDSGSVHSELHRAGSIS
jgi:aminoacyl tRNA synthase complex-interacting multifunctional protein 1